MKLYNYKTKLAMSALVQIAQEIESEQGIKSAGTISDVWSELEYAAGHCCTRAEAKSEIERMMFDADYGQAN